MNILGVSANNVLSTVKNYLPDAGKLVEVIKSLIASNFTGARNICETPSKSKVKEYWFTAPEGQKESFYASLVKARGLDDSIYIPSDSLSKSSDSLSKSSASTFERSKLAHTRTKLGPKSTRIAPEPPKLPLKPTRIAPEPPVHQSSFVNPSWLAKTSF